MTSRARTLLLLALLALLPACTQSSTAPPSPLRTPLAALGGAATGGLLAATLSHGNPLAIAAGVIGGSLTAAAVSEVTLNQERALLAAHARVAATRPVGTQAHWSNPETGHYGTITPTGYASRSGGLCKIMVLTIWEGSKTSRLETCMRQDAQGNWNIVDETYQSEGKAY